MEDDDGTAKKLGDVLKRIGDHIALEDASSPAVALLQGRSVEANRKRLSDASVDIAMGDTGEILFQHTIFCQCSMPYRDYARRRSRAPGWFMEAYRASLWTEAALGPQERVIIFNQ